MNDGILLSEKHGLNCSLEICTNCGKEMSIVLFGRLEDDAEAPKQVCMGHLCDDCTAEFEKEHKVLVLELNEDNNPTGRTVTATYNGEDYRPIMACTVETYEELINDIR